MSNGDPPLDIFPIKDSNITNESELKALFSPLFAVLFDIFQKDRTKQQIQYFSSKIRDFIRHFPSPKTYSVKCGKERRTRLIVLRRVL